MFFTLFGYWAPGGGGFSQGIGTSYLCNFSPWATEKSKFSNVIFDIVTTQYDHPRYVKHVLARIYVFFTLFGHWVRGGGIPKGLVHNLLIQFFTLGGSNIEVSETLLF